MKIIALLSAATAVFVLSALPVGLPDIINPEPIGFALLTIAIILIQIGKE
jgi:hypothetical protein